MSTQNTDHDDVRALEEEALKDLEHIVEDGDRFCAILRRLYAADEIGKANDLADMGLEAMAGKGLHESALAVLALRIAAAGDRDQGLRPHVVKVFNELCRTDLLIRKYADSIGMDKPQVPLRECLRRWALLQRIKPGIFCIEKSWGFGVVQRIDEYAGRFIIDFENKPGHGLTFAYAAEALQIPNDDHLMVIRHRDPARLAAMIKDEPDAVVRLALQSYGPMPVAILQEILEAGIIRPADWKSFWDAARKRLKKDPLVNIPARRSDLIRLLDRVRVFDDEWFAALERERMIPRILDLIREWAQAEGPRDAARLPLMAARLSYVVKGAGLSHPEHAVQAALLADILRLDPGQFDHHPIAEMLLQPQILCEVVENLPAREVRAMLDWLAARDRIQLTNLLLAELNNMPLGFLSETLAFFDAGENAELARAKLRGILGNRTAGPALLFWAAKNPGRMAEWKLGRVTDLALISLEVLNRNHSGEMLKAANQLRDLFQQKEWLTTVIGAMDELQRQALMTRLREIGQGHTPIDTKGIIAKVLVIFPHLAEYMVMPAGTAESQAPRRVTAWSSLSKRQIQLQKIISEEIPQNSRDIAVARGYGDLRENFEYKAAKEQQGILMRRKAELEHDLSQVQGTDFAGVPTDTAVPGTTVRLRFPDGKVETFYILGEWDHDVELGIISSGSALALGLKGCRAGQSVSIALQEGQTTECVIEQIDSLPDHIRAWIKG